MVFLLFNLDSLSLELDTSTIQLWNLDSVQILALIISKAFEQQSLTHLVFISAMAIVIEIVPCDTQESRPTSNLFPVTPPLPSTIDHWVSSYRQWGPNTSHEKVLKSQDWDVAWVFFF